MSKRSRSKANIPIHRESIFWILSPVSCLLPDPPILPILPRIHESIMQNKPNFLKAKTNATIFAAKVYENKPPLGGSKKQSQTNPIYRGAAYGEAGTNPISVSEARFIVYNYSIVPEGPIHGFTARESRIERQDTKYEIREYDWKYY